MFKLDFKKAEESEIKLLTSFGSSKKQEFQRIARRNKGFLCEQCKEIEENNRRLFEKIGDSKGTLHAKMGTIKDRWSGPNRSRRY